MSTSDEQDAAAEVKPRSMRMLSLDMGLAAIHEFPPLQNDLILRAAVTNFASLSAVCAPYQRTSPFVPADPPKS